LQPVFHPVANRRKPEKGAVVFVLFFLTWVLLAGELSLKTCLAGAAVSAVLYGFCRQVMDRDSRRSPLGPRRLWKALCYLARLIAEMLKAGFVVMRLIYTKGRRMEPLLVRFDTDLRGDRARAALADSITLTAGTITVESREGQLYVHALDRSLAEGIEDSGFQRRLRELEQK
jgi:multicomponent Na+:H+ antiporter subunit E